MTIAILITFLIPRLAMAETGLVSKTPDKTSLFSRIGGGDKISKVIDDFMEKLWKDPKISYYFRGMGTDTKNKLRKKNKNLMCANTGGGCEIISRPLDITHRGLGISEIEFYIVVDHLSASLKKYNVPKKEQEELLRKIRSLKSKIIEAPETVKSFKTQKETGP